MDETDIVRLGEGAADLAQDVDDSRRRLRAVRPHELFQVQPVQVLHRVVEHPLRRPGVVENRDRARVAQAGRQLHLALEPADGVLTGHLRSQHLDRGGPTEHGVAGSIDDPHTAFSELAFERVLAQPTDLVDRRTQPEDDARRDDRQCDSRDGPLGNSEGSERHTGSRQRGYREDGHGHTADGERAARRARHGDGARQHDVAAGQQANEEAAHGVLHDGEECLREPDPHQGEERAHEHRADGVQPLERSRRQPPGPSRHDPHGAGDEGPAQMIEGGCDFPCMQEEADPERFEQGHSEKAAGDQKHELAEEGEPGLEEFPAFFSAARRRSKRDRYGASRPRTPVRHDSPFARAS